MTQEQKKVVEENINIVGHAIRKYLPTALGDEDVYQVGCMALMKAVERFDDTLGFKLSTFAEKLIYCDILKYYRSFKALRRCVNYNSFSLDRILNENSTEKDISGNDLLIDKSVDVECEALNNALFNEIYSNISNLSNRQLEVVRLYYHYDLTQNQIAELLGTNQVTISRELQRAHKVIKNYLNVA